MTDNRELCIDETKTKITRPGRDIGKKKTDAGGGRISMGRSKDNALMPVAPCLAEVPQSYFDMRDTIIAKIKETSVRLIIQANSGMTALYWEIGNEILRRQSSEGWGAKVIDRLSKDLKKTFPDMSGFHRGISVA